MSATTFSYAQAARGRTVSQPIPDETSSAAPSTTGSQGKDDASTGATSVTAPSVASTTEIRDTEQAAEGQAESGSQKLDLEACSVAGSTSSTASSTEQSGKTADEGSAKSADAQAPAHTQTQSQSEDKASRSTSRTSRSNDNADGRKGRKGKKSRASDKDAQSDQTQEEDAEKVKEPPKPVVLTEAAPPAVNPWAKRMEAQKAAVQAKSPTDSTPADTESKQAPSQEESGVRSAVPNGVTADKPAQKKPAEAPRPADQAPRRSGPRGSRPGDKDDKASAAAPLAADPSSWPDPKSAAEREQPARKTQDKADTTDKDSQDEAGPVRKKTWEKLEIVHSVVFETQLPPLRGSKPRGGASRGGREAGSLRGSHPAAAPAAAPQPSAASASDKTPPLGASAAPKTATTRPREGSVPSRATSQPQPSKRGSIDAASRDQRKASVPGSATEQARETSLDSSLASKRASATRDIRTENGPLGSDGGLAAPRIPQERANFQTRGEYNKDGAHGQQYPTRDGRPERGRGGAYRARGGHNGSSSHLPSVPYTPNGHYPAPNGFQSRQNPNAHSPPPFPGQFPTSYGHPTRGRGNKWAGSAQPTGRNNSGATGFPSKAAQVNDYAVGQQYPPYMYSPVFDASVSILRSQVEYYLSVENLCKDYYLRQHMDGQGFVHLSTIAAFKRIKAVTEDVEMVRLACSFSEHIEFGVGDDGIERLRTRDKWQHFVLPAVERAEAYRNDGPANWNPYAKPDAQFAAPFPSQIVPQPYPPTAGAFSAYPEEQMYPPPYANGAAAYDPAVNGVAVNGHHHGHETRLSAGVPEYAPPQSPVTLESMTNFPDSQVENLMMILSYDEKDDTGSSGAAGVAGYVSGTRQNGIPATSPDAQSANGEAANGSATAEPLNQADQSERGIVWVDGQASGFTKAQRDRKPYTEIRKAALEHRQNAKAGDAPREMQKLYKFWSQMLLNDFNAKVYQEFRDLAFEDASSEAPSKYGLKSLLEFYDRLLLKTNTRKPWPQDRAVPEIFTAHLNEAVELDRKLGGKDAVAI